MKKYRVNYLNRRHEKGSVGVLANTPEEAINIFKTEYSGRYGFPFASVTVTSVDEWLNGYKRVLDIQ